MSPRGKTATKSGMKPKEKKIAKDKQVSYLEQYRKLKSSLEETISPAK
jgi:hypothetical protein